MARQLDPEIVRVLKEHGHGKEAVWDCHGTWVIYHSVLERIAAKSGVEYEPPMVLVAEKESAAILVTGKLNGKREWSIGEASIGLNYKVSGKQAAYPFAMAEKRAKDRVILKLIGLHGLAYSEEEADDFKASPQPSDDKAAYVAGVITSIKRATNASFLGAWWNSEEEKANRRKHGLDDAEVDELKQLVIAKRDELTKEAA